MNILLIYHSLVTVKYVIIHIPITFILDDLKQNLKTTEDLGEKMKMLQEAARKSAEAKQLRYRACPISQMPDTPMPLSSWKALCEFL
jgi:hypothetical protein